MSKLHGQSNKGIRAKLVGIVLLTMTVFLLAGCTRKQADNEQIRLKFWTFPNWNGIKGNEKFGTPEDWPRQKIKEFEALHPNVKIDLEVLTWQGGSQKLQLAVLSKTYPDVSYLNATGIHNMVAQGVLEPIDPYLTENDRRDFLPNVMNMCEYKGSHYMWPAFCDTMVMAINADIFRERKIEHLIPKLPDRGWTFDEFLQACRACTFDRNGNGRTDTYGYVLAGIPSSVELQMLTLVMAFGAKLYNDEGTEFLLDSPEGRRGLQFLVDLKDKHKVVPPGAAGLQSTQIPGMFMNRDIAMMMTGMATIKKVREAAERGEHKPFQVMAVQPPHLPGKDPLTLISVAGYVVYKQPDKKRRDMAMEFARFLTNEENCKAVVAAATIPVRHSAGNLYPGEPDQEVQARLVPYGRVYYTVHIHEIRLLLDRMYQQVFTRAKTPDEALRELGTKAGIIMERERLERLQGRGGGT